MLSPRVLIRRLCPARDAGSKNLGEKPSVGSALLPVLGGGKWQKHPAGVPEPLDSKIPRTWPSRVEGFCNEYW